MITELPQDWGNRILEGTNKPCAHQDSGERSSDPKNEARLACEHPGVSGGGVGQQWPATGSGTLNTTFLGVVGSAGINPFGGGHLS